MAYTYEIDDEWYVLPNISDYTVFKRVQRETTYIRHIDLHCDFIRIYNEEDRGRFSVYYSYEWQDIDENTGIPLSYDFTGNDFNAYGSGYLYIVNVSASSAYITFSSRYDYVEPTYHCYTKGGLLVDGQIVEDSRSQQVISDIASGGSTNINFVGGRYYYLRASTIYFRIPNYRFVGWIGNDGITYSTHCSDVIMLPNYDLTLYAVWEQATQFDWDTPKVQGQPFNITASEWNRMNSFVETRVTSFTSPSAYLTTNGIHPMEVFQGELFYASVVSSVCSLIMDNPEYTSIVQTGNEVSAEFINHIRDRVNNPI